MPWDDRPFSEGWERLREMGARAVGRDVDALAEEIERGAAGPTQGELV